ncbi:uracil-DNA glycosylase [Rhodopirellula sallentina]|uniref:Type-4 uracil-DNA glycosylase n=1 Tax=Rhodopirellula sallentina SM41 TaxID=1263870 RepID=M5UAI2_9BACT|nr:uracil-DNA glycosylase [Rhodopirellula sallentina]EMI54846.1 phage SPO1 DNA polymerase-related protein [Rhodopirellula sallentina SM41]
MPWRHDRDENPVLISNLSQPTPNSDVSPAAGTECQSAGEIAATAGELFEHLRRSGIRFVPQPTDAGVQQWSDAFVDAAEVAGEQPVAAQPADAAAVPQLAPPSDPAPTPPQSPPAAQPRPAQPKAAPAAVSGGSDPYAGESLPVAQRIATLQTLAETVAGCTRCKALAQCRTQTVFGEGNPAPRFVFFGEGPGADEDKTGRPFVGRAGQLLTKMIEASRLQRDEVYIMNTVKCRPPGNRNPEPSEVANCREYFEAQLQTLRPEYIVCLGAVSSQALLQTKLSIGRLRQKFHQYHDSKVLVIYHPAYLLRNPDAKRAAWADLQMLMKDAGL